jgi:hypothetical protein
MDKVMLALGCCPSEQRLNLWFDASRFADFHQVERVAHRISATTIVAVGIPQVQHAEMRGTRPADGCTKKSAMTWNTVEQRSPTSMQCTLTLLYSANRVPLPQS